MLEETLLDMNTPAADILDDSEQLKKLTRSAVYLAFSRFRSVTQDIMPIAGAYTYVCANLYAYAYAYACLRYAYSSAYS